MKLEIILAEFGPSRGNAGDSDLPADRLEPSLSSFLRYFPEATAKVYTDQPWKGRDRVEVCQVTVPTFNTKHPRYGWRENDYWCARGILESKADIAISVDSDLLIVSKRIRSLIPLAQKFGLCMPVNGRHLVYRDARSDCDGGRVDDETEGGGMCHCTALWAFETQGDGLHRHLLETYCDQIQLDALENKGARGPLSLWRAEWKTGISPYTLPSHYCVTGSNLWVPAADAIVLHVGHESVKQNYQSLIESIAIP